MSFESIFRTIAMILLMAVNTALFDMQLPDQIDTAIQPLASGDHQDTIPEREDLVFAVQVELVIRGFDPGPIDGISGPRTEAAIRAYRTWQGASGSIGINNNLLLDLQRKP